MFAALAAIVVLFEQLLAPQLQGLTESSDYTPTGLSRRDRSSCSRSRRNAARAAHT